MQDGALGNGHRRLAHGFDGVLEAGRIRLQGIKFTSIIGTTTILRLSNC